MGMTWTMPGPACTLALLQLGSCGGDGASGHEQQEQEERCSHHRWLAARHAAPKAVSALLPSRRAKCSDHRAKCSDHRRQQRRQRWRRAAVPATSRPGARRQRSPRPHDPAPDIGVMSSWAEHEGAGGRRAQEVEALDGASCSGKQIGGLQ